MENRIGLQKFKSIEVFLVVLSFRIFQVIYFGCLLAYSRWISELSQLTSKHVLPKKSCSYLICRTCSAGEFSSKIYVWIFGSGQ